jgi:hypothetical protein
MSETGSQFNRDRFVTGLSVFLTYVGYADIFSWLATITASD